MSVRLLVSPLARGAYFDDWQDVAAAELSLICSAPFEFEHIGPFDFITLPDESADHAALMRLSFCQGLFRLDTSGALYPSPQESALTLPEQLVTGSKYPGKTNEKVTQLALNVAIANTHRRRDEPLTLLDPLAGRGTTLLTALRYGISGVGIEIDDRNLDALHQHVRKQTKLHRIKHQHSEGRVGSERNNRSATGTFRQYSFTETGTTLRLVIGDARNALILNQKKTVHMIVSDLPYGIQHVTGEGSRNPLVLMQECAPVWAQLLRRGGAMVLMFNSYQPKRDRLIETFSQAGLSPQPFSAAHRMSESIVRDLVVFTKP